MNEQIIVDTQEGEEVSQPFPPIPVVPAGVPKWYRHVMTNKGQGKHECKHCGKNMTHNNVQAYGNLLRHFQNPKFPDCEEFFNTKVETTTYSKPTSQPTIDSVIKGAVLPEARKKELDNAVVDFVIMDEQAIRVVEGKGFTNLMKKAVPYYKVLSRYNVIQEMNARLDKRRILVKNLLDSALYVILVLDGWTSRTMESYMGLVAHLLMPDGEEHTVVMTCRHFQERHTANNLSEWFQNEVENFGIKSKLVRIGTDSAANMLKAFREFGTPEVIENETEEYDDGLEDLVNDEVAQESVRLLAKSLDSAQGDNSLIKELRGLGLLDIHFRCTIHFLQLAIKDFIKDCRLRNFEKAIAKANQLTKSVRKSTIDTETCKADNVTFHAMNQTRWNSMYTMINSILKAQVHDGLLDRLNASEKYKFRASDINVLRELRELLTPLKEFTDQMQANSFTMGLMSKGYDIVQVLLEEIMGENLEDRFDLVTDLLSKLDNRLGNIMKAPQTRLSAAFDPRTAYSALKIHDNKSNVLKAMCAAIKFDKERNQNIFAVLANEPRKKKSRISFWDKASDATEIMMAAIPDDARSVQEGSPEEELAKFTTEVRKLEMQLAINPLKWWVGKQHLYPVMFKVALIYLFGPVGTASVERLFSLTGRLCRAHRSKMKPETLEMVALLKSGMP